MWRSLPLAGEQFLYYNGREVDELTQLVCGFGNRNKMGLKFSSLYFFRYCISQHLVKKREVTSRKNTRKGIGYTEQRLMQGFSDNTEIRKSHFHNYPILEGHREEVVFLIAG